MGVQKANKTKVPRKEERGSSKPVLATRLSSLMQNLDKAQVAETLHNSYRRVGNAGVVWQNNSVFEQPSSSDRQV